MNIMEIGDFVENVIRYRRFHPQDSKLCHEVMLVMQGGYDCN